MDELLNTSPFPVNRPAHALNLGGEPAMVKRPKRIFVIDGMALAFRSYYAFGQPLTTAEGLPTSVPFGTAMFLNKLLGEEKPDYFAVALDSGEPTFRHQMFKDYKANRTKMPDDMAVQMPYFLRLLDCYRCPVLRIQGVEADDIIGTMANQWSDPTHQLYIVSGDKDFMQLINSHIFLYKPKKGLDAEIFDEDAVQKKFLVSPKEVIDCLALMGDSSDNVPGVKGIGEKGAAKLIERFGTLENIYQHLDGITNKRQRDALESNKDLAFLSKDLVTIKVDVPLKFNLEDTNCDYQEAMANVDLLNIFHELEFKVLAERIAPLIKVTEGAPLPKSPVEPEFRKSYKLVNNQQSLAALWQRLEKAPEFSWDTETTGLDIINDLPIGISFGVGNGEAYYLPLVSSHLNGVEPETIKEQLIPLMQSDKVKIGHNLKYDLQMLENWGITVAPPFLDTMVLDYLIDVTTREHGLDACCLRHFGFKKIKTTDLIGKDAEKSMLDVDLNTLSDYASEDADFTFRLMERMMPKIKEKGLHDLLTDIEMPLIPILAKMEQQGVYVDGDALALFSERLHEMAKELEGKIYEQAGEEFNINSTKQLQRILFEKLKIDQQLNVKRIKKTKTGFSTDESVLNRLSQHPLARDLLEYRTVTKLKNTYVDSLPQLINPKSGRIHTSFHQTGTATGRLSSSQPNLQNIPIRTDLGQEIRKAFKAKTDYVIVSADYSQVELRILASIAEEETLALAFAEGADIHTITAAKIFGVPESDVDKVLRSRAKAINFGIIYGMGARRLAQQTGVTLKEAAEFIEKYFATYPKIKGFIESALRKARQKGYSTTLTGRRRDIPGINSNDARTRVNAENMAVNSPIQGSAADLIKLAMIEIDKLFKSEKVDGKMLLQVHDELLFECHKDHVERCMILIKKGMTEAMKLSVRIDVDIGYGENWLLAH